MIGYLKGHVLEQTEEGKFLIQVSQGLESAVGYSVFAPHGPHYDFFQMGQPIELFIHTHVREDQLDLYGFLSTHEKAVFLSLLNVSGIGPKSALTILSKVGTPTLIQAIMDGNSRLLQGIPGIGKKTSERMVIELQDTVRKKVESGQWSFFQKNLFNENAISSLIEENSSEGVSEDKNSQEKIKKRLEAKIKTQPKKVDQSKNKTNQATQPSSHHQKMSSWFQEAKEALIGLGYREQEVYSLLHRLLSNSDLNFSKTEDLIKVALKELSQ